MPTKDKKDTPATNADNQKIIICKPTQSPTANEDAMQVIEATIFAKATEVEKEDEGIIIYKPSPSFAKTFINAIAQHRFWDREKQGKIPA